LPAKRHGAGISLVASRDRLARDTLVAALVERLVALTLPPRTLQFATTVAAIAPSTAAAPFLAGSPAQWSTP